MPFFILGSSKSANVVVVLEGPGPELPDPGTETACLLYDIRHEINTAAEEKADAGDASDVFKIINVEQAALEIMMIIGDGDDDDDVVEGEGAYATLQDAWKWIRAQQHADNT